MEREVGGGIGMGNTCKPLAVSFQCMTKSTTNKKKKKNIHQYDTENVPPGKKYGSCTKERTFFYQKLLNRLDNISLCKSAVISLCWSHLVMKYEVDQIKKPN